MGANSQIGNVDKIVLKTRDANDNDYETTISSKKLKANPTATYTKMDTAMRALSALSTNTYNDTILITNVSVNDEMEE